MRVLFAPDYRRGVPYQQLLADALARLGVEVEFLSVYRRGMPLYRAVKAFDGDLVHLHWPEEYYLARTAVWSAWRKLRYPLDLALASRNIPFAVTAHDLAPHNREREFLVPHCAELTLRRADAVFAHAAGAARILESEIGVSPARISVVPLGDLSVTLEGPMERAVARAKLQLGDEPLCLMFGTIEPYKGIEPVMQFWRDQRPAATLAVVGKPISEAYKTVIANLAAGTPNVMPVFGFQSDERLCQWLSAADCVVVNYTDIFTSGAAALARSWGVPVLLPRRLETVDLDEPDPRVVRFERLDRDFSAGLATALSAGVSWNAAAGWRERTSWDNVARGTLEVYQKIAR